MSNNYNRDLYKILNVSYDATEAEIKASYRRLVHIYHPDVAGENFDVNKFKEIQEAYEVISDANQRKKYDIIHGYYRERLRKETEKKQDENKINEYIKYAKSKHKQNQEQKAKEQPKKESFSKSINEALDNLFHSKGKSVYEKEQIFVNGEDIKTDVKISAVEAVTGTSRKINILHTQPCPLCNGRKFINETQCSVCAGIGQVQSQKKINVKIPKGVKNGAKIRIKKEGNKGMNGGTDGDLYLIINIEKSKYFSIIGSDILINLPISPVEAALGANIQIKLPKDENITIKIPPLTSSGQKFRLLGLGLKNKGKIGDVIITALIKMPEILSDKEKDLYEQLKTCSDFDVRKDFRNEK